MGYDQGWVYDMCITYFKSFYARHKHAFEISSLLRFYYTLFTFIYSLAAKYVFATLPSLFSLFYCFIV